MSACTQKGIPCISYHTWWLFIYINVATTLDTIIFSPSLCVMTERESVFVSLILYCTLPTLFMEKNRYQGQLEQKACFCLITKMCTHCLANVALIMMGSAGLVQTQRHLCVGSPGLHYSYLVFLKGQSWQLRLLGTLLCNTAMAQWQSDSLARQIFYAKYKALF